MINISIDDALKNELKISQVLKVFPPSGQKNVFVIECEDYGTCVLKIFKDYNSRDEREIKFYDKFNGFQGIPKTIKNISKDNHFIRLEEFIEGKVLLELKNDYNQNYPKIKNLLIDICNIMNPFWFSDNKIVHRDLKPANIIIKSDGSPIIIDFGIHKDADNPTITFSDYQPHTLPYSAPEQLDKFYGDISHRTDYYSLGLIAYELFFGEHIFDFKDPEQRLNEMKSDISIKLHGIELSQFILETLNLYPSERPRNNDYLLELLI